MEKFLIMVTKCSSWLSLGIKNSFELGVMMHACNPNTWEAEAGGLLQIWDQPKLQSQL